MRSTVVIVPDEEDGEFAAYVPAIPNRFIQAPTREEAFVRAADATEGIWARVAAHDEELPGEAPGATVATIEIPVPAGALA